MSEFAGDALHHPLHARMGDQRERVTRGGELRDLLFLGEGLDLRALVESGHLRCDVGQNSTEGHLEDRRILAGRVAHEPEVGETTADLGLVDQASSCETEDPDEASAGADGAAPGAERGHRNEEKSEEEIGGHATSSTRHKSG